jgi:C_GCAxxG_C_C family probable redox protein
MLFIMGPFKRRKFLASCATIPFLGFLTSCKEESKPMAISQNQQLVKDPNAMALSRSMDRAHVYTMLDRRVEVVMEKSHNCAQTTFYVLSEQFGLGGDEILKALTPLPGMAERGETCGAITGALMAMGLIFGRDRLDDWEKYRSSLIPTNKFCTQFQQELGSSLCCQIQERAFGKSYNLMNPDDLREFQRAGATSKCSKVVQKACRLAADIILETAGNA